MSMTRQTILASRPAAMVLALSLVAAITTPVLLLPRAQAQTAPVLLPCTQGNNNGCTELSPTPPQDTVSVPPNIVLMLDDSGSMSSDYMPDWGYLQSTASNDVINSADNGTYYNPTVAYLPPPQADGTLYPSYTDITSVPKDGFNPGSGQNLTNYSETYSYSASKSVTSTATYVGNFKYESQCINAYYSNSGTGGYTYSSTTGNCTFNYKTTTTYRYFKYATGTVGSSVIHYVASMNHGGLGCGPYNTTTTPDCVLDTTLTGMKDAAGNPITIGENIANWFAYDHTRIQLAKTGLMTAFNNLNPNYRFGFSSINANNIDDIPQTPTPYTYDDYTSGGGDSNNQLAVVQPFGAAMIPDPSDPTGPMIQNTTSQRYAFWNWIANESANRNTPLRKALNAVGMYYSTSDPWKTLSTDPGYPTTQQFACRASYTILTTDGFWNGQNPSGITAGLTSSDGTVWPVPANDTFTQYKGVQPFSGGKANSGPSLADIATYYWENDLNTGLTNEVATSKQDPAAWQHMTTFTMGLGFTPSGIKGTVAATGKAVTVPDIFAWAHDVDAGVSGANTEVTGFSWPQPSSNNLNNIADLAHAAVNGHGDFFSVKSPQDLAAGFAKAISDINARNVPPTPAAVNVSVLTAGALTFETGYNTGDWSGSFKVVELAADGSVELDGSGNPISPWPTDPDTLLDTTYHGTGYASRKVYTANYNGSATPAVVGKQFSAQTADSTTVPTWLDSMEANALQTMPALAGGKDVVANRINYLLGDKEYEGATFRSRTSILGAVINASPLYVNGAQSNYNNSWPSGSAEIATGAQSYDDFVTQQSTAAPGMVYIAANDGMLHAFNAPVPNCKTPPCTYAANSGSEAWAFIPRAVYANLGNLVSPSMNYRPTVDETPVTRDVFFGTPDNKWHTILAGTVGLGGRGVYALDITNPSSFTQANVLWEFDSDMTSLTSSTSTCYGVTGATSTSTVSNQATQGTCNANDLGYTISEPNIARLADGQWAVLVSNGYFPDCSVSDYPTDTVDDCNAIAAQVPMYNKGTSTQTPYSALFVLDAQTGKPIAELKTPQGVPSFGLATPVLGDLTNNNVDNVAYAGDALGNLWKFNLGPAGCLNVKPTPCDMTADTWTVSLVYQAQTPGAQPITTMPRLFPDPVSNGFMVVFGTGKFFGVGDNSNSTTQAVYGIRDPDPADYTQSSGVVSLGGSGTQGLTQNYLHEEVEPATIPDPSDPSKTIANPLAGETLRCLTGGANTTCDPNVSDANHATAVNDSSGSGGWYYNLVIKAADGTQLNAGERIVVSPGAIFASNTVVLESLITGAQSSDPCSPTTTGAIMAVNGATGAPAGVSSLGGWPLMGGRITNARTSGSLPIVSALGGGQAYLPGTGLAPSGKKPFSVDAPIWRRRSWSEINQGQ